MSVHEVAKDARNYGKITDETIAQSRALIGTHLVPDGPYLQDVTADTSRNFCNGIGDLNPLFRDSEHGRRSHIGAQVAHPLFPMAFGYVTGSHWGLPGVPGFYAGNDWEFYRYLHVGDRITAVQRVVGVKEKESRFSGRLVIQYAEATYFNQRQELVARCLGWSTRHERQAAREHGKYEGVAPYEYSDEERRRIFDAALHEDDQIRGPEPRFVDDLTVGDQLSGIVRGPLTHMDTTGFLVGCGRGHTHGVALKDAMAPSGHFRQSPEGGAVDYVGAAHHDESVAREDGVPGIYDYGPQRTAWLCSLVTNWVGDLAFVKRLRTEIRRFNTIGDTTWCKGRISRLYEKDGHPLIDIEIWAENQRGEVTAPGSATVILPSRSVEHRLRADGSELELELPVVR